MDSNKKLYLKVGLAAAVFPVSSVVSVGAHVVSKMRFDCSRRMSRAIQRKELDISLLAAEPLVDKLAPHLGEDGAKEFLNAVRAEIKELERYVRFEQPLLESSIRRKKFSRAISDALVKSCNATQTDAEKQAYWLTWIFFPGMGYMSHEPACWVAFGARAKLAHETIMKECQP